LHDLTVLWCLTSEG